MTASSSGHSATAVLPGNGDRIERGRHRHLAQPPTSTSMSQLIDIRDRRPTLPGGALHIAGAVRRDSSDPPRPSPVLVARSFGLRPYPASGERRRTPWSCTSGSSRAVVRGPWTVPPHEKAVTQTRPAAGSAAGAVGDATALSEADHETSGRPALWHPLLP